MHRAVHTRARAHTHTHTHARTHARARLLNNSNPFVLARSCIIMQGHSRRISIHACETCSTPLRNCNHTTHTKLWHALPSPAGRRTRKTLPRRQSTLQGGHLMATPFDRALLAISVLTLLVSSHNRTRPTGCVCAAACQHSSGQRISMNTLQACWNQRCLINSIQMNRTRRPFGSTRAADRSCPTRQGSALDSTCTGCGTGRLCHRYQRVSA
jgi:hypothetical protein